ncbi:hypothetical protein J2786_000050 [Chryseobacterium vietnamense]|jgi:hypothetical protein|uniref:Uncharacterized protein n=1 Tax=Chryseobacterium vietnamense TaxID=866785 RepID=A0ACC6J240_9FLAO|nr:hypothetical protein [Chryseobacterium vietnamense]MDR6456957.1 hypothetical protein [Chryseobacterium vietnamense]
MKQISLILALLYGIILISCQNSKKDLNFIDEIKLPYTVEIKDYEKFVNHSFEKKDIYNYAKFTNILGKQTNVSKIDFIGKFIIDKQEFILYQDVTQNESADFFPALYVTKIGKEPKTFCLTQTTEESFTDKIIINDNKIILRENYWDPNEKKRKNDRLKEYNFDFVEVNSSFPKKEINHTTNKDQRIMFNTADSLILSKECDLNMDNIKDKILIISPKNSNTENRFSSVYVLIYNKKGEFKEYHNNKIINSFNHSSYAEGFQNLTIKNNFFTIEENISSQPIQDKYTTFTFDKKDNSIYLHKLGYSTTYPDANQDNSITYSSKDFGTIKFEKYDPEMIKY